MGVLTDGFCRDEKKRRQRLFAGWQALRDACCKSHKDGPGGAAICVCGAAGGGSPACSMLGELRNLVRYADVSKLDPDSRRLIEELRQII